MKILQSIVAIFCFNFTLIAQNNTFQERDLNRIKFDHLTIEDGLANSTVRQIIQDEKGFIWAAALNALCRYDGYEFITFKHNPKNKNSLSGDRITALIEDEHGHLLVGTWQQGLDILNPETGNVIHYKHDNNDDSTIGSNQINSIYVDKSNRTWIGASNTLNLFDESTGTFTTYTLDDENLIITSIVEYIDGELWICTNQLRIFKFDLTTSIFTPLDIIPESHIDPLIWKCRFYIDSKDILWISAVRNGLYRYDKKTGILENFRNDPGNPNSLSFNEVFEIVEDEKDKYWIATDGGGLNYFNYRTKKFLSLKHNPEVKSSITNNKPYCLLKDNTGILWVGLYNGGINIYDRNKEKFLVYRNNPNDINSLSHNIVWSLFEDSDGDILIGTDRGGLNIYNPVKYGDSFKRYTHNPSDPRSIPSNTIISIFQDSKGRIWLGTYNKGLIHFNKKNRSFTSIIADKENPQSPYHPAGNDVWDIEQDDKGRLWIATLRYGVDVYDTEAKIFTHYRIDNSNLSSNEVTTVKRDSKNRIWVGTADGLNLYNIKINDFIVFKREEGNTLSIPGNNIRTIFEDKEKNIWIGTEGSGLCKMNLQDSTCINYSEEDGLPSNVIYGILQDENKNLWISTSKGLSKYSLDSNEFKNYTYEEGLQSNEFKQNSCLLTRDGRMFFGGIEGFNIFYPDSIHDNPNKPPVYITGFTIFNQPLSPSEYDALISENESIKEITLTHKQSMFSFTYTSLNYTISNKNAYAYMLEGFDNDWNYVKSKKEATYTNLDPGEYIFRVKASNNDGVWNEEGTSIKVTVLPACYQTKFFIMLVILLPILAAILFYFYRINQIKRQNEELELNVNQRTKELREANKALKAKQDEITTQNEEIHQQNEEILTQRDEIKKKNEELEKTHSQIKTLSKFGQELTNVLELEAINKMIYNYVSSLLDTSVFGIGIYDEKRKSIVFNCLLEEGEPIPEFESKLTDTTSCAAWCFKNQEHIFSNDFENEYQNFITEMKIRSSQTPKSIIYLPLNAKQKNIGILTLQSYKLNAYTDNDIQTLQTLASYIAIALDNANAYKIVQRQNKILEKHGTELEKIVDERTRDLVKAKLRAEESDKLKSAFLANMSHEIRTPLNAIVGFAELLTSDSYEVVKRPDIIKIIEHNSSSLLNLINDIIDFSKIEAGEINITINPVKINYLLNEVYQTYKEELRKHAKDNSIKFILKIENPKNKRVIYTDIIRLRQILNNLIDNAIKYTNKGKIEIGYKIEDPEYITFFVKDTGIGIEKKYLEVIFDRFRKIEDGKMLHRGTGLGLSITKYLLQQLGGEIWVESTPNKGSEFYFTLPSAGNKEVIDLVKMKTKELQFEIPDWMDKTALVAEDEDSNYLLIESILQNTKIKILRAKDGEELINIYKAQKGKIHIILMDIKMPGMDGITAATEIGKMGGEKIPIVAQTAYALPEEEHRIRAANFVDYIPKPISRMKLIEVIANHII